MWVSVNLFLLITSQVSAELWMHFTAVLTLGRLLILNERQEHSLIQWDLLICWIPHVFHHVAQMHNYPLELGGTSSLSSGPTGDQQWRLLSWCSCVTAVSFTRLRTARCWPRCVQFLLHCLHNCSWAGCGCLHSCPHHHNSWSDGWWLEPPWEPCSGSGDHQSVSSQSGHSYSSQVLSSAQAPAMADVCSMSHVPSPWYLDRIDMTASCHCLVSDVQVASWWWPEPR